MIRDIYMLRYLFFWSVVAFSITVSGQTDGQVLTRVDGGASWADALEADGDAWGVNNEDQVSDIIREGSVHIGAHGNVTGYEFSISDDNGGGVLLMGDNTNDQTSDGDTLGVISFDASDNLSSSDASAMIVVSASADHIATSKGADIHFSTKSNTDGVADEANERIIITNDGKVGVNTEALTNGPNSTFHARGSMSLPIDVISSVGSGNYTVRDNQHTIIFNAAPLGNVVLPTATDRDGRVYRLINRSGSGITITPTLQILGGGTNNSLANRSGVTVQAANGNWYLTSN